MTWNGMLRSVMVDEKGSPELFKELSQLKGRVRAERLRTLALIGLAALNKDISIGSGQPQSVGTEQSKKTESHRNAKADAVRNSLRDKLTKGF